MQQVLLTWNNITDLSSYVYFTAQCTTEHLNIKPDLTWTQEVHLDLTHSHNEVKLENNFFWCEMLIVTDKHFF